MNFKYLTIIPVLLFNSAFGQLATTAIDGDRVVSNTSLSTMLPTPPAAMASATPSYDGGGDADFMLFIEGQIGPLGGQLKGKTNSVNPEGFEGNIEIGVRLPVRRNVQRNWRNSIAFGVGWQVLNPKYTVDSVSISTNSNYLHLPVKYTSMRGSRGFIGFYWEAGMDFNYYTNNNAEKKLPDGYFSKVFINTSLALGLYIRYESIQKGQSHYNTAMLGPYVGYALNNVIAASNITYNPMVIGVRLTVFEMF